MRLVIINATDKKSSSYFEKELFLKKFQGHVNKKEFFLSKDLPDFCCNCANCVYEGEEACLHGDKVTPIWEAMKEADVIVFAAPVVGWEVSVYIKSLFDHLRFRQVVVPTGAGTAGIMKKKKVVVLTNGNPIAGIFARAQIRLQLNLLGISQIVTSHGNLLEGEVWEEVSEKQKDLLEKQMVECKQKLDQLPTSQVGSLYKIIRNYYPLKTAFGDRIFSR